MDLEQVRKTIQQELDQKMKYLLKNYQELSNTVNGFSGKYDKLLNQRHQTIIDKRAVEALDVVDNLA